jgi:hypothetical protein
MALLAVSCALAKRPSTNPEPIDASNGNLVLACAELIIEDRGCHPHTREQVDQLKATIRQLAQQSHTALRATALCWLIFNTGEHLARFDTAWKQSSPQRR